MLAHEVVILESDRAARRIADAGEGLEEFGTFEAIIRSDDDSEGRVKMNELVENL